MFRYFWTPNTGWTLYRDEPKVLAGYVERAGAVDCYTSLNVWPKPPLTEELPGFYDFGFDFDSPDISKSAAEALKVWEWIEETTGCMARAYFSGSKGFHIVIPHFRIDLPARLDGGRVCKLFQAHLADRLGLETLDVKIHGARRVFRVPNTVNSKTGLYKIPIGQVDLEQGCSDSELFKRLAVSPRNEPAYVSDHVVPELRAQVLPFIAAADEEAEKVRAAGVNEGADIKFLRYPPCMMDILGSPKLVQRQARSWQRTVPSRNDLTFAAATFLRQYTNVSEAQAQKILGEGWQKKVAKISGSGPSEIAQSTKTCIESVWQQGNQFHCGFVISRGCTCSPNCALFKQRQAEKDAQEERADS